MTVISDEELWKILIPFKRNAVKMEHVAIAEWVEDMLVNPRGPVGRVAPTSVVPHAVTPQKNGESVPTAGNVPGAECPVCVARRDAKRAQMAKARAARKGAKAS